MAVRVKRLEFAVAVERDGSTSADGAEALVLGSAWTAEHLLLAALARCTLASLGFHTRRARIGLAASATADGTVTRREDGSWGFVEIACAIDAELDPAPAGAELDALLARAERGCFVGASLAPSPRYRWRVNGAGVRG